MKTIKKLSIVLLMSMAVMPVFAEETNEFKVRSSLDVYTKTRCGGGAKSIRE